MNLYAMWLIAYSVLLEGIRRKEIYVIVLLSTLMIGAVLTVDFFGLEGLTKFYREVALKVMSGATAITAIVLSARQLPREFEKRTIYPLLAKPVSRLTFILGKLLGVLLAAVFCFSLFMGIFILGSLYLGGDLPFVHLIQFVYLQLILILVVSTLSFWLSLLLNLDAAITIGIILYLMASLITSISTYVYDFADPLFQFVLKVLTFALPQLTLFDFSEKAVHAGEWPLLGLQALASLTIYGAFYAGTYFSLTMLWFQRRPL